MRSNVSDQEIQNVREAIAETEKALANIETDRKRSQDIRTAWAEADFRGSELASRLGDDPTVGQLHELVILKARKDFLTLRISAEEARADAARRAVCSATTRLISLLDGVAHVVEAKLILPKFPRHLLLDPHGACSWAGELNGAANVILSQVLPDLDPKSSAILHSSSSPNATELVRWYERLRAGQWFAPAFQA
jgi:hypothetical protein